MSKKDKNTVKEHECTIKDLRERNTSLHIQLLAQYQELLELRNVLKDIRDEVRPIVIGDRSNFTSMEGLAEYVYDTVNNFIEED